LRRCWSKALASASISATGSCSTATSAGDRSIALSVAIATDGLTRIYGCSRARTASAVRRFGMGLIDRIGPLKDRLMAEARGHQRRSPAASWGLADLAAY
jgi:hypothetical protein